MFQYFSVIVEIFFNKYYDAFVLIMILNTDSLENFWQRSNLKFPKKN